MEHVKPNANGILYVEFKVPSRLRPIMGMTNYRRTLESKTLDRATRDKAIEYIAEYHRLKREAEKALQAGETKRKEREKEEARQSTLRTFGFEHEQDLTEFIDFCASGWPNAEASNEIFNEAVRQLTTAKNSMRRLADVENYIVVLSKRLDTARRLVEACKITPSQSVAEAFDKTLTVTRLTEKFLTTETKTDDTERQYRAALALFLVHTSDKPITDITREDARAYRDYLHGRTDLTHGTCDQRLKKLRAMFNFAKKERFLKENPFEGIAVNANTKEGHGNEIDRTQITPAIINVTLTEILPKFGSTDSMRWPYLIMLFTGARIEEVCGLRLDEIVNHWDVNCFHIRPRKEDNRTVKTKEARYTPIHKALWDELGFSAYVEARRKQGKIMLFDFPQWREKFYSSQFSQRMKSLRATIEAERGIDLGDQHSLRHNITNLLRAAGVSEEYRCLIVGQAYGSRTNAGYGTRDATLEHLRDALHKIELSPYDFSKLCKVEAVAA